MILGVVLAGGQSTRFGSDKALAELDGRTLIARAVDALSAFAGKVVVAGRSEAPAPTIADWPRAGMGPLGGIAAALRLAQEEGHDAVLSCGVDSHRLPHNLPELLSPPPAYLSSQPVIGLWPASAASTIETILNGDSKHSMRAFAEAIGARAVNTDAKPANINTPSDLAAAENDHGI